ncbi:MAG: hypothetical protein IKZ59_01360 [Clostridia bacterium]|nr:hypothetical protein [Clostridia bacterium]
MELRKTVNAINAICGDGKRIEIFYGELGADCGYYYDYRAIGENEYLFETYVCAEESIIKGEELPILTVEDCISCIAGKPSERIALACEKSNVKIKDIKELEIFYRLYVHHTLSIEKVTIMENKYY